MVKSIAITHQDDGPPGFAEGPSGELLDTGKTLHGVTSARFTAVDAGSGVRIARVIVDGQSPASATTNLPVCPQPYVSATPCTTSAVVEASVDTTQLADGPHAVTIEIEDAGGNRTAHGPIQIRTENFDRSGQVTEASSIAANGVGASRSAQIVGVGASRRRVRRQRADRSSVAVGRLIAGDVPIAGAAVWIHAAVDVPGARTKPIATATTEADGRFRFEIPKGTSRRIEVRYRAFSTDERDSAIWRFKVAVPAPIRLTASPRRLENGDNLRLTASVAGGRVPIRSADVAFQVRIGRQWRTFARRSLGRRSRAVVDHRFRVTFDRMTYRFRALTLKRRAFPYANAVSRVASVRVN